MRGETLTVGLIHPHAANRSNATASLPLTSHPPHIEGAKYGYSSASPLIRPLRGHLLPQGEKGRGGPIVSIFRFPNPLIPRAFKNLQRH